MAKVFNVTAVCMPEEHYMVNIDERLCRIKEMIDCGKYFTINRARQYGKTTTLMALEKYLQKDYLVVSMDFLAQLRAYYIRRTIQPTFQSVILAGVYDIKNLKRKLRPEDEHQVNSPWNIAADFDIDMSLTKEGIATMLEEYEADHHTGMHVREMAARIYDETSGYPFLVSRLCQLIDEKVSVEKGKDAAWTLSGFKEAERMLLSEKNTLFESVIGKVVNYPELDKMLREHIFNGRSTAYTASNPNIDLAVMFGIIKNVNGRAVPANKIFDTLLSDYYLSLSEMRNLEIYGEALQDKNQFLDNGRLNMRLVLEKFTEHFTELYGRKGEKFMEEEGRKYFLLYLRPIINGVGNYSMEAVTRSLNRTDLIVYYHGEIFVIEMKIWRGPQYHESGEKQLLGYMEDYHQNTGYMITFNFNKKKEVGVREMRIEGKVLIEAVV